MQLKQANLVLGVSMAVVALIVVVAAVWVFLSFQKSSEARTQSVNSFNEFGTICSGNPSPTEKNIDKMVANVAEESEWKTRLLGDFSAPLTFRPAEKSSDFRREEMISALRAAAPRGPTGAKVVDEAFQFGFDAYKEGRLPKLNEVPRLQYQLELIDAIIREMYAAEVLDISVVKREEFDLPGDSDGGRSRQKEDASVFYASNSDSNGNLEEFPIPLNRQWFHFEFRAKEKSVVELLNRLASMDRYVAVTYLEITKGGPDIADIAVRTDTEERRPSRERGPRGRGFGGRNRPPRDEPDEKPGESADAQALPASRDLRIFTGRDFETPAFVKMNVEVYAVYHDATENEEEVETEEEAEPVAEPAEPSAEAEPAAEPAAADESPAAAEPAAEGKEE